MNYRLAATIAAATLAIGVQASTPGDSDPIRRALQDIEPASGVCTMEDPSGSPVPARRRPAPADFGCAIGVEAAAELARDPKAVIVDLRRQPEHDAFRIDGALRMDSGAIKTKQHLRERALVLVGSGQGDRELYAECASLKKAGFKKVHVLRGGMKEWIAQDQPLVGHAPAMLELAMLKPVGLYQEAAFDKNIVLVDGAADRQRMQLSGAQVVHKASPATFKASAISSVRKRQGAPFSSIVVVLGDSFDRRQLPAIVEGLKPHPALIYADGAESYGRFLDDQKAMWLAQARGPKTPGCRP